MRLSQNPKPNRKHLPVRTLRRTSAELSPVPKKQDEVLPGRTEPKPSAFKNFHRKLVVKYGESTVKTHEQAGQGAKQVKARVTKPDNLSLIPLAHTMEGEMRLR